MLFDDDQSSDSYLSLHEIAAENKVELLTSKLLSLHQIDLDEKNRSNRTPLHEAAINNRGETHIELAEILLNHGADVNATDCVYRTPLWYLVQNCNLQILRLFLRFNADFTHNDVDGASLLSPATNNCHNIEVIKFLVEDLGLDVNHKDRCGTTPLHYATLNNENDSHYEVLKYLLDMGADVNAKDKNGDTPLWILVRRGNWKVIELFINHKADLKLLGYNGKSIIFAFQDFYSNYQVLDKLISDFGLDVNHTDNSERTFLHYILNHSRLDPADLKMIKCLLKNGANINAQDKDGLTPLINAVRHFRKMRSFKRKVNFHFLLEQMDFSVVQKGVHILGYYNDDGVEEYHHVQLNGLWMCILEHLAKLHFLKIQIYPITLEFIQNHTDYKNYFEKCTKELKAMSEFELKNSWLTYFNVLVDSTRKLKNYAANEYLIEDYESKDWINMFPIYGDLMKKNVEKGIERRKLFDESSFLLSDCLPIFKSSHLIIKDIFDCILCKKDLSIFCECEK